MKPSPFKSSPNRSGIPRLVPGGKVSAKSFNKIGQYLDGLKVMSSAGMRIVQAAAGAIAEPLGVNPTSTHPFQVTCLGKLPEGSKKRDNPEAASPFIGHWEFFVEEGFISGFIGMASSAEGVEGSPGSWSSMPDTLGDYYHRPEFARAEVVDALKEIKYTGGTAFELETKTLLDNENQARFYIPDTPGTYYFVLRFNREDVAESGRQIAPFNTWAIDWETRADFVARGEMETWINAEGKKEIQTAIYRIPIAQVKIINEPAEGEAAGVTVKQLLRSDVFWPKNSIDFTGGAASDLIQQFEVRVDNLDRLQIAKGGVLWSRAIITTAGGVLSEWQNQGDAVRVWSYPDGTLTTGGDPESPWVNDGGFVELDTDLTYSVFLIANQDANIPGDYEGGTPVLAVIADGSEAWNITRPVGGYSGRAYVCAFDLATNSLIGNYLFNYNHQRIKIADVSHDGSNWVVAQKLFGPITIPRDIYFQGCQFVASLPTTYNGAEKESWEGTWAGYTRDGSAETATLVYYPPPP